MEKLFNDIFKQIMNLTSLLISLLPDSSWTKRSEPKEIKDIDISCKETINCKGGCEGDPPKVDWTCSICLEGFQGQEKACEPFHCKKHAYCVECVTDFFQIHIQQGSLNLISCPNPGCRRPQPFPHKIQELVSSDLYERFLTLRLNWLLADMKDIQECPKCHIYVATIGDHLDYGHCSGCHYCFCSRCGSDWHLGRCSSVVQDVETQSWLANETKRCPNCLVSIQKNGGCDHMYCVKCRTPFNWSQAPFSIYYKDHVNLNLNLGPSRINPTPRTLQTNSRKKHNPLPKQTPKGPRVVLDPDFKACPYCGRLQGRQGNSNHVTCGNCKNQFCFVCKSAIKGTSHFASGQCPQHC